MKDFITRKKDRIAVLADRDSIALIIDRGDSFTTVSLTHQEARRAAFLLMGSSDPYRDQEGT